MSDAFLEFNNVYTEDMGVVNRGRVKLSDSQVVFKNDKTGKVHTYSTEELSSVEWIRLANQPGIRLVFGGGDEDSKTPQPPNLRIGGFKESDQERIGKFVEENWNKKLKERELALKGWNYGEAKFKGPNLEFRVDEKLAFEVPLQNVSKCIAGKNEATLEFHQNDDAPAGLMEMRFFMAEEDAGEDRVEAFRQMVMKFAGIEADSGQPVAILEEILCTTPRGRYDIKVYPNHLSFHGKTYDYKIPIKTITRQFLVPHKDGRHMYFVISVSPPIRQGQTRYGYLVLEFSKDEQIDLELGMTDEQLQELYGGKLEREQSGALYEVVSKIFRVLVNMRITVPGNFVGHSGTPAIACAHKQASGFIYPLEKGLLYIHKPPMYIRFEEISCVHFARSDVSTKSFDFEIEQKNGQTLIFNSVEKEEYNKLFDFVQNKGLRIRNAKKMEKSYKDDFEGSDDDIDPYKATVKEEGKTRGEGGGGGSDDDSDEDDSDYDLDKDLEKRRRLKDPDEFSGSEPDEEWDSDADSEAGSGSGSGGSGGEEDEEKEKKKREKKEKRERKRKEKRDDGEEGGGKRKRSKKEKDPNAPKRALTAYFIWLNENRSSIKKDGDSVSDTAKRGGEMWKAMSAEDKKEYEERAAADKERYEREMKEYKKNGGGAGGGGEGKKSSSGATRSPSKKTSSPQKAAKSKEFVESSDDSDSDDDKPLKPKDKGTKKKKEATPEESGSGSGSDSD